LPAEIVEQTHPRPEEDGHDVNLELVEQSRVELLLDDARAARHLDVLVARR
jgi:hypothetical protein